MRIIFKHFLLLLFFAFLNAKEGYTEFQQNLVDDALRMASTKHNPELHPTVKAVSFLNHELALTSDPVKAKNIADTILELISKGQGVGGISARQANPVEADLLMKALSTATHYLIKEEGLTPDHLTGKIGQIATEIGQPTQVNSDITKAHFAQVSTILFTAYAKHADNITNPSVIKPTLRGIIDASSWLKVYVDDDRYWEYVQKCLDIDLERQNYNAHFKKQVDNLRRTEEEHDKAVGIDPSNYAALVVHLAKGKDTLQIWEAIAEGLQTTLVPEKAEYLSKTIRDTFRSSTGEFVVDFKQHLVDPRSFNYILKTLIVIEKYRVMEIGQGSLKTESPSILDYQGTNQDAKSEAILLALVSAIQNYLLNPAATPADLIQLFIFQKNDHHLTPAVQAAAQQLIRTGEIARIINDDLFKMINQIHLRINIVQKLVIDEAALKQLLVFTPVPQFDFSSPTDARPRMIPKFMRFIRSYGNGQCGYYSLRLANGKTEYVDAIVDNLEEPAIAGKISALLGSGPAIYTVLTDTEYLKHHVQKTIVGFTEAAAGLEATDQKLKDDLTRAAQTLTETVVPILAQLDRADIEGKAAIYTRITPLLASLPATYEELRVSSARHKTDKKTLEETKKALEGIQKQLKTDYDKEFKEEKGKKNPTSAEVYQLVDDKEVMDKAAESQARAEIEGLQAQIAVNAGELAKIKTYIDKIDKFFKSVKLNVECLTQAAQIAPQIFAQFRQKHDQITPVLEGLEAINKEYEQDLIDKQIPAHVENGSDMSELKRAIRETFNDRKKPLYDQLSSLIVLASPVEAVRETIDAIETDGWLDIGAKHNWRAQDLTFPHVISLLKGYDIYVWVKADSLLFAQAIVSDGEYKLVTFISNKKDNHRINSRQIHLYNSDGGVHFDKWVEDDNYPDLADALRHKQKYHQTDTRPTPALKFKTSFSGSFRRFGSAFSTKPVVTRPTSTLITGKTIVSGTFF